MVTINDLLDLDKTIAKELFAGKTYPWEVLDEIKSFILKLGETLDPEEFDHPAEGVWVAKDAKVFPSAYLGAPCIIDHGAEIRHCAFMRGSAIVGKNAVVGNSVELKNVVLFDNVQVPHYNYVGDSVLGYKAHMGAGSITSNVKSDKTLVVVKDPGGPHRDRPQEVRRHAGRLRGGRLQQRAEPRHRHRPPLQRLSHLLRPRRHPRQLHLQGQGGHRAQSTSEINGKRLT